MIANSFPKGSSDWTRVRSFALSVDRSRASLSLVLEVGQRAGPWSAGQSSDFVQLKVVESWSFTKRVVFQSIRVGRAETYRKECWRIDLRTRGEGN